MSVDRILTTHVGSLPRPPALLDMMQRKAAGEAVDGAALAAMLREEVAKVVARQAATGIDLVSDGEFSKPSYATYVAERLTGFGGSWKGRWRGTCATTRTMRAILWRSAEWCPGPARAAARARSP